MSCFLGSGGIGDRNLSASPGFRCLTCRISEDPQSSIHRLAIGEEVRKIRLDQYQVSASDRLPIVLAAYAALEPRKIVLLSQAVINCFCRLLPHTVYVPLESPTAH